MNMLVPSLPPARIAVSKYSLSSFSCLLQRVHKIAYAGSPQTLPDESKF